MRIIRGKYKGFTIYPPSNLPVRPTTDFAKTGLFNIIENRFDISQCNCLDLFSGTGSISLEFLSRGCKSVTAVDRNFGCMDFLKKTAVKLQFENLITFKTDIFIFLKKNQQQFDIIFADPPFDATIHSELVIQVFDKKILNQNGWLIIEHSKDVQLADEPRFAFNRSYGNVTFSFFTNFDETKQEHP